MSHTTSPQPTGAEETSDTPEPSVTDRIKLFLQDEKTSPELVREYLNHVLVELRNTVGQINRSLGIAVLLVVLFVLIAVQGVQEVSFGGVKLGNLHVLSTFIPVVVAGVFLRVFILNSQRAVVSAVYRKLCQYAFPGMYQADLEAVITPSVFILSVEHIPVGNGKRMSKVLDTVWSIEVLVFMLLPVGFSGYAYVQIFTSLQVADLLAWLSLILSVALYCLAVLVLVVQDVKE